MPESIHDKLSRVRKPHVHVTMGKPSGELAATELPFVLGILGDFSGDSEQPRKAFEDRRFVEVDRDRFGEFMSSVKPAAEVRVRNVLARTTDTETDLKVKLSFSSMDDFEPAGIVNQVPALKKLLEARNLLRQLGNVMDRSRGGEHILEEILQSPDKLQRLREEVGRAQSADSSS